MGENNREYGMRIYILGFFFFFGGGGVVSSVSWRKEQRNLGVLT